MPIDENEALAIFSKADVHDEMSDNESQVSFISSQKSASHSHKQQNDEQIDEPMNVILEDRQQEIEKLNQIEQKHTDKAQESNTKHEQEKNSREKHERENNEQKINQQKINETEENKENEDNGQKQSEGSRDNELIQEDEDRKEKQPKSRESLKDDSNNDGTVDMSDNDDNGQGQIDTSYDSDTSNRHPSPSIIAHSKPDDRVHPQIGGKGLPTNHSNVRGKGLFHYPNQTTNTANTNTTNTTNNSSNDNSNNTNKDCQDDNNSNESCEDDISVDNSSDSDANTQNIQPTPKRGGQGFAKKRTGGGNGLSMTASQNNSQNQNTARQGLNGRIKNNRKQTKAKNVVAYIGSIYEYDKKKDRFKVSFIDKKNNPDEWISRNDLHQGASSIICRYEQLVDHFDGYPPKAQLFDYKSFWKTVDDMFHAKNYKPTDSEIACRRSKFIIHNLLSRKL